MRFVDLKVWADQRCALGREAESGRLYMSIPVSNRQADYEEYYEIDQDAFERFSKDAEAAAAFAGRCRRHELDHLLIVPPGRDRGA